MNRTPARPGHHDVIVVGAGFAGLVAARELSHAGLDVLVVEARDRIGGRTWLDERMGMELEIGGTWVHWVQPHVWAELRRYGIGLAPSPLPETAAWWNGEQAVAGTPDQLLDLLDEGNTPLLADAMTVFPLPYSPLSSTIVDEIDGDRLLERIRSLGLTSEQASVLEAFWTLNFNGRLDDAAFTQALRWVALTNGDWKLNFEACATYKIAGGTKALASAIASDSSATYALGVDVASIDTSPGEAIVVARDGRRFTADAALVTVPLHAQDRIAFTPELSASKRDALDRGQLGLGTKTWFTVEGEHRAFVAMGAADWPLTFFQSEYVHDGKTYVIGFGPDAGAIDPFNVLAIQEQLSKLRPDLRVLESAGHDWVHDEYSGETWPMHRTGFLTRSLAALREPHGAIHFAGSDLADGWGGFIDGAIESALSASRTLIDARRPSDTRA
ncbi:NAD(P)/FAD-dependent oxidoreductase [Herbiconiux sp.]|uniref:flavin monoamine oxidase family protein n=1 Tax=Herbiconiux sp. TaxID=1871186 RepID=UPI0025BA15E7|nr:NAD(P)/FAD-dependent oxidoreductase [Herbiconiux sp.]